MSIALSTHNSTIVTAFYNELFRQGLVVAVIRMLVGVLLEYRRRRFDPGAPSSSAPIPKPSISATSSTAAHGPGGLSRPI
jgi:hypothetical protein